jgi:hypothetical protein
MGRLVCTTDGNIFKSEYTPLEKLAEVVGSDAVYEYSDTCRTCGAEFTLHGWPDDLPIENLMLPLTFPHGRMGGVTLCPDCYRLAYSGYADDMPPTDP